MTPFIILLVVLALVPDFHGESSEIGHVPPTPYINHPTGGGPPPGAELGDERPPRR